MLLGGVDKKVSYRAPTWGMSCLAHDRPSHPDGSRRQIDIRPSAGPVAFDRPSLGTSVLGLTMRHPAWTPRIPHDAIDIDRPWIESPVCYGMSAGGRLYVGVRPPGYAGGAGIARSKDGGQGQNVSPEPSPVADRERRHRRDPGVPRRRFTGRSAAWAADRAGVASSSSRSGTRRPGAASLPDDRPRHPRSATPPAARSSARSARPARRVARSGSSPRFLGPSRRSASAAGPRGCRSRWRGPARRRFARRPTTPRRRRSGSAPPPGGRRRSRSARGPAPVL